MDLYKKCLVYRLFVSIANSIIYIFTKRIIFVKAWVRIVYGKVIPNNWGDDINIFLLEMISKKKVGDCNSSLFHRLFEPRHFICIGSILGWYESKNSEIWGAGFISNDSKLNVIPQKIHSVRGKLTRNKLLKIGIECPESYGDPALLLSKYYSPTIKNRYKIGIVPHFADFDNPIIDDFINRQSDTIKIKMKGYTKWTDVIDQICSCDIIFSSSLHGLIIADSYKIPNVWIKLSDNVAGGNFKFLDYFSSVERHETEPYVISRKEDIDNLTEKTDKIKNTANINFDMLIDSCPFKNI